MSYRYVISVAVLVSVLVSCKSTSSSTKMETKDIVKEESLYVQDETDKTTPAYLWSKDEREVKAMYYYLLGETYFLNGNLSKASSFYENAYNLDSSPVLGGKILGVKSLVGDEAITVVEAKKLALRYPSNPQLRYIHGMLLYKTENRDKAIKELKKAISLDPRNEVFSISLAGIYEAEKDYDTAKDVMIRIHRINPSVNVSIYLARLYLISKEPQKAYVVMKKAYELDSFPPEGVLLYALILEANELKKEAVDMFEQLYRMNSQDEKIVAKLVSLYASLGDLSEANDLLDELLSTEEGKGRPSLLLQKVYILWFMERNEEADDILEKLHETYPEQDRISYILGLSKEKIQDSAAAIKIYSKIPNGSEYKKFAVMRVISILLTGKEYKKAILYIDSATRVEDLKDIVDKLEVIKLSILEETKDYKGAYKYAKKLVKTYPDNMDYLFYLGVYQEKIGDFEGAEGSLKRVIAKDPTYSAAYNHLGYLYAEKGIKLDEAQMLLEQALKLKPDDPYYIDSLGWVYFKKNQFEKALKYLLKSDEIQPDEPEVMEHIAECYLKLNKITEAKTYYKKVMESSKTTEEDKLRVKKILDSLDN